MGNEPRNAVAELNMENLVERFYEPLFRFALSLAGSEPSACDLTQETFYLWAAKGHQLRDHSKVKTWLFTTLYREFLASRRRETRFPHHSLDDDDSFRELPAVSPDLVNELDGPVVMKCLQRVDETFRVPLTLFYVRELSYQEIAAALEIPIGTVMSRLSRGKAQLRRRLGDALADETEKVVPLPRLNAA